MVSLPERMMSIFLAPVDSLDRAASEPGFHLARILWLGDAQPLNVGVGQRRANRLLAQFPAHRFDFG